MQRIALHSVAWAPVIYSQLAGNALSKIAPAGRALGGALQYRMLVEEGAGKGRAAAAITAVNLLTFAVVLVLPVLAIPAFLTGSVDRDLVTATLIGLGVLVLLVAAAITCSRSTSRSSGSGARCRRRGTRCVGEPSRFARYPTA